MHDLSVTLVAVATPPGRGGIGCVRISGPAAREVSRRLFRPQRESEERPDGCPRFGRFLGRDARAVDHGYLVTFEQGASFTGETTAELWTHGSPAVLAELIEAAVAVGASPAGPGEFTYRALRHGRLDLVRAEAIRDLIAARTLYQARVAFSQTEGALSRRLAALREALVDLIVRGEAAVEFGEEADVHLSAGQLQRGIGFAKEDCAALLSGFRAGRVVREGATVAITGMPNVGKSSIFNRLLERDRAIVSASPGTTRDTLEEVLDFAGIPVRLVDTAGLREVEDPVEQEGVRRARQAGGEADLVLLVLDGSRPLEPIEREAIREAENEVECARTMVIVNKKDLSEGVWFPSANLHISALTGEGVGAIKDRLRERLVGAGPLEPPILTDARHAHCLEETRAALDRAESSAAAGFPEEIVLEDLREAIRLLGMITGEFAADDLYQRIFSTFCIGK